MGDDELRFQLDLAKVQLRNSALNDTYFMVVSITIPLATSIGLFFIGVGYQTQNDFLKIYGTMFFVLLLLFIFLLGKLFNSNSIKKILNDSIDREFKILYDKYLSNDSKDTAKSIHPQILLFLS